MFNKFQDAVERGTLEEIDLLLSMGATIDGPWLKTLCCRPHSILTQFGGMKRHLAMAKGLIERGASVDTYDNGMTALMWSVWMGNNNLARLLIDHGANVNLQEQPPAYRTEPPTKTALMRACLARNRDGVEMLILAGADLHIVDSQGFTAWSYAILGRDTHIMNMIRNALKGILPEPPLTAKSRLSKLLPRWRR